MKTFYLLFVLSIASFNLFSQTIVSTSPENKKVILEEFTGIHCTFCPQGHLISQNIMAANPGNAFAINIHTGSFAVPSGGEPDFRISEGAIIAGQTNLSGYPAGTVNRHEFSGMQQNGTGTAMSRSNWTSASNQVLGESSYVNIAAEATIDVSTRELTVHVEAYYTGNSPQGTNKLNVALLQNNVEGPQTGMASNPTMVLPNGNYNHQHMLRHLLTGQWGDDITTTTSGSFIDRTYNYTLPLDIAGVDLDMSNLEIVVFVAEGQQEIISGNDCIPTYSGFAYSTNANLVNVTTPAEVCGDLTPDIKVQNYGSNDITSIDFSYSVNGGPASTYTWNSGTIVPPGYVDITLPSITFTPQGTNTVDVTITSVNGGTDENISDNNASNTFNLAQESSTTVYLDLLTDNYGSETSWELYDGAGTVVYQGGGYSNNQQTNETFNLTSGCYNFVIHDAYGDGICCSYGTGHYILTDDQANTLMNGGSFGSIEETPFKSVVSSSVIIEQTDEINAVVYPNPSNGIFKISVDNANNDLEIEVVNLQGQVIYSTTYSAGEKLEEYINLEDVSNGLYIVKIQTGDYSKIEKLTISK